MVNEIYKISFSNYYVEKFEDQTIIDTVDKDYIKQYQKYPLFNLIKTQKDEKSFVENFANPLCSVTRTYTMVVIEGKEDKISLKVFNGSKSRVRGKSWFRASKNVDYLTINKKTGDFYYGYLHNYQKKKKYQSKLSKNIFWSEPVNSFISHLNNSLCSYCPNSSTLTHEILTIFFDQFYIGNPKLSFPQKMMKFYLDKKSIKYPDNFWIFSSEMWGKNYRKSLKKNDNRLIDTIMSVNNFKGKKIKKCLHVAENLNLNLLKYAISSFEENWLNQDEVFILKILNSKINVFEPITNIKELLSHEELKKAYSCFKAAVCENFIGFLSFQDHVAIYNSLKEYGELGLKWTSDGESIEKFQREHNDWSERLGHYRRGFYTRHYPTYFISKVEKNIGEYYPVLLKDTTDFNSESDIQSNCVRSYIGKSSSFIISLRKGGVNSTVRATIQYHIKKINEKIIVNRIQTLGRHNQNLDLSWNEPLLKLDEIVLSCIEDKMFETPKIEKTCKNGMVFKSETHFDENGNLVWTNKVTKDSYNWEW